MVKTKEKKEVMVNGLIDGEDLLSTQRVTRPFFCVLSLISEMDTNHPEQ